MSELITLVQKQDPGSELVELFEVTVKGTTLYFHSGIDDSLTSIQFRDRTSPYTVRTYTPFPISMEGVEYSADGAQNRPSLTVANVANTFSSAIGNIRNEDLIGERVVKRTTLKKYLYGEPGDATPPVEFPFNKYIIDRISAENNTSVVFELSAPFDLSGIQLPNRSIVGKYCSWQYQGNHLSQKGGCIWSKNSVVTYTDGTGGINTHKAYFTELDEPIVPVAYVSDMTAAGWAGGSYKTYTTYSGATSYSVNSYVEYNDGVQLTVWKCIIASIGNAPSTDSIYWEKADICGKKLSSCKCRFQFSPANSSIDNSVPSLNKNTGKILPFGAFIGSMKFR
jgi:lambda family phage minor tail protein L